MIEEIKTKIVVLDRGWVYVGKVTRTNGDVIIEDARCIRRWGTSKGLGELRGGPLASTELDDSGTVIAPEKSLIHMIQCTRDW